jgi:glycogen(starch) synthase
MRILFISAYYPPFVIGGWEQLVHDINIRLQARGHITRVLTSLHGVETPTRENGIDRILTLENDLYHYKPAQFFVGRKRRLQRNLAMTEEIIQTFDPHIIFIHGMWNLSKRIPWIAEQLRPGRVVYYMASDWPFAPDVHAMYWQDQAKRRALKLPKKLLAAIALRIMAREVEAHPLQFEHVLCVSQAVKDDLARCAGIPTDRMHVVYTSVETDRFMPSSWLIRDQMQGRDLSLLFAGSIVPHKGVHTAVEAMAILARKSSVPDITLTIVGSGHPDYEDRLRRLVNDEGLSQYVKFLGRIPREQMPNLLQKFDVLIFPTVSEEPLARMTMEAMATGLVVVGTTTGGTKEILIDGETGLTFEPGDAVMLARQIEILRSDPELCARLAHNAREMVAQNFDLCRMIDEIEGYLSQVVRNKCNRNSYPHMSTLVA